MLFLLELLKISQFIISELFTVPLTIKKLQMIQPILINLLSNAAKFTQNGTVTMSAKVVSDATGRWLDFTVRDTGIGIAEASIGKLFGDFVQADASVAGKFGGTGLGLSLCRKFCLLLGGTIEVTSRLGEGSAFKVQVPLSIEEMTASEDAANDDDEAADKAATAAAAVSKAGH